MSEADTLMLRERVLIELVITEVLKNGSFRFLICMTLVFFSTPLLSSGSVVRFFSGVNGVSS